MPRRCRGISLPPSQREAKDFRACVRGGRGRAPPLHTSTEDADVYWTVEWSTDSHASVSTGSE